MNTHDVLTRAAAHLVALTNVFMDSGVENLNGDVDPLFERGALRRVIAQIDVTFSNSLIEAWWRSLKHRWLFLHPLDNLAAVRRLVEFYVTEHNERIPHGAFEGQTPDEMYFGRGGQVPNDLALRRREARQQLWWRNSRFARTFELG
jgi:putative transposase